jgi:hypothetical protein
VQEPDQNQPITSPVTIRVSFQPQDNAGIDLTTFRVTYYGLFGIPIDITSRILEHAELSDSGIYAKDAELPSGHHRVTVEIADGMGRVGAQPFEFTVV